MFELDPAHSAMDIFDQPITQDVWKEKYRFGDEAHPNDTFRRIVSGLFADNPSSVDANLAYEAMAAGLLPLGGRIMAGAGTDKRVTLINCYVMPTIEDSLDHIFHVLGQSALTMQQGGGIGMDFSTLRPEGAPLITTGEGATSSGPTSYMDVWDAMCRTIMSAGSRRGAMMATMRYDHPDIRKFISAKREADRLRMFNVSVLVDDHFMNAVRTDNKIGLWHEAPPDDPAPLDEWVKEGKRVGYTYDVVSARELWREIIHNTYQYSEPGIIFIDRVNKLNNLSYCETISATNPCGEQPLPPYGACCLGAVNLARMVQKPFTDEAYFDYELLAQIVRIGVICLNRVLDTTYYPLPEQRDESMNKRRIGLGITGLANAMMQLGFRYGDGPSISFTKKLMSHFANSAYSQSATMAIEDGPFPFYDADKFKPTIPLNKGVSKSIKTHGIRNGVVLTIAPTGTTSIFFGNVSSGLEPVFSFTNRRKVLQPDGSFKEYDVQDYGYRLYRKLNPDVGDRLRGYMATAQDLKVRQHLLVQGACQEFIDSSISKTINVPEGTSFEDFEEVYKEAYELGCKGCTTYKPSEVRGSVLEVVEEAPRPEPIIDVDEIDFDDVVTLFPDVKTPRPGTLRGRTYKINWPSLPHAIYITINDIGNPPRPFEIFVASKSAKYGDWATGLCLMISAIFRRGGDVSFVADELKQVISATEGAWVGGEYVFSPVAQIGKVIEQHINSLKIEGALDVLESGPDVSDDDIQRALRSLASEAEAAAAEMAEAKPLGEACPTCGSYTLVHSEGCSTCQSCGYSNCG